MAENQKQTKVLVQLAALLQSLPTHPNHRGHTEARMARKHVNHTGKLLPPPSFTLVTITSRTITIMQAHQVTQKVTDRLHIHLFQATKAPDWRGKRVP